MQTHISFECMHRACRTCTHNLLCSLFFCIVFLAASAKKKAFAHAFGPCSYANSDLCAFVNSSIAPPTEKCQSKGCKDSYLHHCCQTAAEAKLGIDIGLAKLCLLCLEIRAGDQKRNAEEARNRTDEAYAEKNARKADDAKGDAGGDLKPPATSSVPTTPSPLKVRSSVCVFAYYLVFTCT